MNVGNNHVNNSLMQMDKQLEAQTQHKPSNVRQSQEFAALLHTDPTIAQKVMRTADSTRVQGVKLQRLGRRRRSPSQTDTDETDATITTNPVDDLTTQQVLGHGGHPTARTLQHMQDAVFGSFLMSRMGDSKDDDDDA